MKSGIRSRAAIAAAAVASVAAMPAAAEASVVSEKNGGTILVAAAPGETNNIELHMSDGRILVRDSAGLTWDPTPPTHDASDWYQHYQSQFRVQCAQLSSTEVECMTDANQGESATVNAGDGDDSITLKWQAAEGANNDWNLYGGSATMRGGSGNDTLRAEEGAAGSIMVGGPGADKLHGSRSADNVADYRDHPEGVSVTVDNKANDGSAIDGPAGQRDYVDPGIKLVYGSQHADHLKVGAVGPSRGVEARPIYLEGRDGDDTLEAGTGGLVEEYMHGGAGNDRLLMNDGEFNVAQCNDGHDTVINEPWDVLGKGDTGVAFKGGEAGHECESVRTLKNAKQQLVTVFGTASNDFMNGSPVSDRMVGLAGNDALFGQEGNDVIEGGAGSDRIDAGPGNDSIDVKDGQRDRVTCGPGRDTVVADKGDKLDSSCERPKPKRKR